ncbi:hypothetical protein XENTR_v10013542 [Xenopus tropicalis]|nr:hypothetical protein XENTR_v10013542 [Xenopus tropicalis]
MGPCQKEVKLHQTSRSLQPSLNLKPVMIHLLSYLTLSVMAWLTEEQAPCTSEQRQADSRYNGGYAARLLLLRLSDGWHSD